MKKTVCILLTVLLACIAVTGNASDAPMFEKENGAQAEQPEGEGLLESFGGTEQTDFPIELASSGTNVWRIREEDIVCEDVAQPDGEPVRMAVADVIRQDAEALQLSADENAKPVFMTVISGDEERIRLCLVLKDAEEHTRVILNELACSEGNIRICRTTEITEATDVIFGENAFWLETDMTGLGDSILIYALDNNMVFHVYRYEADAPECTEFAAVPLTNCTALLPYGEDILMAGQSAEVMDAMDLKILSPDSGEANLLKRTETESNAYAAMNFAFNEKENILYYSVDNIAYRLSLEPDSEPVPFAVMEEVPISNRNVVIVGDRYVLYGESGELLLNDIHAELQAVPLCISDMTGIESVREIAAGFSTENRGIFVTASDRSDEESLLTEMLNQSNDYDVYITEMNSSEYSALKAREYLTELDAGESVRKSVADMPDYIRNGVLDGDRLRAIPVGAECECLTWNVNGFTELTGLSREELPTDWTGFLELLGRMAEDGTLDGNTSYMIYEVEVMPENLKELLFSWILQDCLMWVSQDENRINELPAVMTPILQALDRIEWSGLGLLEEEEEDLSWLYNEERIPLLSLVNPEIAVMYMEPGTEYWPLSVTAGGDRLVPQTVSVMWINPWSEHQAEALDFLKYYWDHMDILTKMTLCRSMNEPVINTEYNEDVAYLEQMIPEYQAAIGKASTEAEAEALRGELEEMEGFLNDYKENARWSASEQSIAEYRSLAEQMALTVPEFWSADEEDAAVLQYLDGMISADQFVNALVTTLRMQAMED